MDRFIENMVDGCISNFVFGELNREHDKQHTHILHETKRERKTQSLHARNVCHFQFDVYRSVVKSVKTKDKQNDSEFHFNRQN